MNTPPIPYVPVGYRVQSLVSSSGIPLHFWQDKTVEDSKGPPVSWCVSAFDAVSSLLCFSPKRELH